MRVRSSTHEWKWKEFWNKGWSRDWFWDEFSLFIFCIDMLHPCIWINVSHHSSIVHGWLVLKRSTSNGLISHAHQSCQVLCSHNSMGLAYYDFAYDIWIGEVWRSICLACVSMNLWSNLWFTIIIDIPYSLVYEISTMNIVCSLLWYLVTFLMTLSTDKITNIIIPTYFSSSKYQLLKQVWHTLHLKFFVMECCCGWL